MAVSPSNDRETARGSCISSNVNNNIKYEKYSSNASSGTVAGFLWR